MNDERKAEILYLWNKIEEMLYGNPRFDVKPQETFDVIENSLVVNELAGSFKEGEMKKGVKGEDVYKTFLVKKLEHLVETGKFPIRPELPGIPGMPPYSTTVPMPGMPPLSPNNCFDPVEPPGSRMAPGCSGHRTPDQEREEIDKCKRVKELVCIAMEHLGLKYEDEKTYKVIRLIIEANGFRSTK